MAHFRFLHPIMHPILDLRRVGALPNEIHEAIIGQADAYDLKALSCVSKGFRKLALKVLFNKLTFSMSNDFDFMLSSPMSRRVHLDLQNRAPLHFLKPVRHVQLDTLFEARAAAYFQRCPHVLQGGNPVWWHRSFRLMPVFGNLKDNALESLSWNLGICPPRELFSSGGYLAKKQTALKSLSLITDGNCARNQRYTLLPGFLTKSKSLLQRF